MSEDAPGWTHPVAEGVTLAREHPGLSTAEATRRAAVFGANVIVPTARSGIGSLLRAALGDPMLWFLVLTAGLFGALGNRFEAFVLLAAIVPLFGMDLFLHGRVHRRTAALASRLADRIEVQRDGHLQWIAARALVPGDHLRLTPGTHVPADTVLIAGDGVQIDESALTGESLPVRKQRLPEDFAGKAIAHRHWIGAGTRVLTGDAGAEVIATGAATAYGELARAAADAERGATPLQQSLRQLVIVLLVAALALCLLLAAVRLWQGFGVVDALLAAAALAVAAIPEEFPMVFASFLGVGVYRLARRRALVRRAAAVEALGRISCICTDKTGTLTEGRVMLSHRVAAAGVSEADLLRAAAIAANADSDDPVDAAVLAHASTQAALARFPFTEARRREVAIVARDGGLLAAIKGAPETVFARCALPEDGGADWRETLRTLTGSGHKVLAVGECRVADAEREPEGGFRLLGLLAFEDPLRAGVHDAITAARAAGVRVIVVTGDHPATARAIAAELGLGNGAPRVVLGDHVDPDALPDVVARCLPTQKLALVQALQARGERVAVTGDGINDVPALRGADVGIAMGERGTAAARDAAAIVLLDDAFDTLVAAIAEGRQLFANLRAAVAFLLLAHLPLVLTAALLPLAGFPLPYPPLLIVWLELLIHPLAFLAFQQPASGMPASAHGDARFFDARQWWWIAMFGLVATAAVAASFVQALGSSGDITGARGAGLAVLSAWMLGCAAGLSRLRGRAAMAVVGTATAAVAASLGLSSLAELIGVQALDARSALIATTAFAAAALAGAALARALRPSVTAARHANF